MTDDRISVALTPTEIRRLASAFRTDAEYIESVPGYHHGSPEGREAERLHRLAEWLYAKADGCRVRRPR